MRHKKRPRPAVDQGAAQRVWQKAPLHSSPAPTEQGTTKRNTVRGGMTKGRTQTTQTFSVTDGRETIGCIVRYGDRHNARWIAFDVRGKMRGCYSTEAAAIRSLPAAKVAP